MARFEVGSRVMRVDTQKKGVISFVSDNIRGRQFYIVNWGDRETDEMEMDLVEDCDISNVFERCKRGLFGSYAEFARKNTSSKIQSSNNNTISSLKASKTLFRAYQFKPLLKFINSPNRRLLVADEVGLGKTIEAGHIMLELKARRQLRNALIICPKSLQEKWRAELREKFGLLFKIYDSPRDLMSDFEDRDGRVRAIINYEKIRYSEHKKDKNEEKQSNSLVDYLYKNDKRMSLVLCDEAHRMRNADTHTYKGAEIVMNMADSVVFLTATPIMISTENLYNLLHLLDRTRFFNYQIFNARLQENTPFVRAITALNYNQPMDVIADNLLHEKIETTYTNAENIVVYNRWRSVEEVYEKDPVFQEIKELLSSVDSKKNRARLQYLLNSMSVMNNIFSRTRKKDVTTDMSQAKRDPLPQKIVLTSEEQEVFDEIIEEYIEDNSYTDYWGEEHLTQGGALGLVQKKRQVASSVYAYLNTDEDLDKGIDRYADMKDAKFEHLVNIIEEVFRNGTRQIVVFALFRRTLKYLQVRLQKRGYTSLMIHGLVNNRAEILEQFKTKPQNQILLSSEVGSEGLDMQFCDSLVNYDLPWNPMVVEQRIGRIDRFGQKSPVVHIYNFIVAGSIQEEIYMRLLDRIGIFRGTIGDMEAILDSPIAEGSSKTIKDVYNRLERELYTNKLSEEDIRQKLDEISLAYEKERLSIEELEKGLTDALTNDAYFKEEIDRIRNNNAYVTEKELKNYLETVIEKHLTTCNLIDCGDKIYEIKLPMSDKRALTRFLTLYQTEGDDNEMAFNTFKHSLEDMNRIRITFNQEKAYENRSLIYLNIYHPIIQACLKYFSLNKDEQNRTFCFSLPADGVLSCGSSYYMCVYKYVTTQRVHGVMKKSEALVPFVFNMGNLQMEVDEAVINRLYGASQVNGIEYNPPSSLYADSIVNEMRVAFLEASTNERRKQLDELQRHAESERLHDELQTKEYFNVRLENLRQRIKEREEILNNFMTDDVERQNIERVLKMDKGLLESRLRELQDKIDVINEDNQISVDCEPQSLVLIYIG